MCVGVFVSACSEHASMLWVCVFVCVPSGVSSCSFLAPAVFMSFYQIRHLRMVRFPSDGANVMWKIMEAFSQPRLVTISEF